MIRKGDYKLTYYFGYDELGEAGSAFELYDIENDPEELENIYSETSSIAQDLKAELMVKIKEKDKLYS
jgi:arylsulfatase A-like enzyme